MFFLAEFGGTNARFALADPAHPGDLLQLVKKSCSDFDNAEDAVQWFLKECSNPVVEAGCIAIAGPTDAASMRLTNRDWELNPKRMSSLMGAVHVSFLNDFEALAYALPFLPDDALFTVKSGAKSVTKPMAVLGPGTGLGVGGLLPGTQGFTVVTSEGGGIGFAPDGAYEEKLMKRLSKTLGRRVTCEDILCGVGLVSLYQAIAALENCDAKALGPADVSELALAGSDPVCHKAVMAFCGILGHFAGDVALMFNASGGVYLGGGILEKILPVFRQSDFNTRFEARGTKSHLVEETPVYLIEHDVPALIGASFWLKHTIDISS